MLQASRAALGRDAHGHVDASFPVSSSGHRCASRISASELLAPSAYAEFRSEHQHHLIAHRRRRTVALGPDMRLQFEDRVTVLYQIQEVLRAERAQGLDEAQHEIDTYACLLSDGRQWKATRSIECPCPTERARRLPSLSRAAHELYVETAGTPRLFAEANEDLEDRHLSRPSAVHFLTLRCPRPCDRRCAWAPT